jgi:hypothetical protein
MGGAKLSKRSTVLGFTEALDVSLRKPGGLTDIRAESGE